jgi:hypothetical protein
MKKFSFIIGIVGLLLVIGSMFLYQTKGNAVDSGGSMEIVTWMHGQWTFKLPMFEGGVFIILAAIFYISSKNNGYKAHYLPK